MQLSSILRTAVSAALLLCAGPAQGTIIGLAIPATVAPGTNFPLVIASQDTPDVVQDVSLALGFTSGAATDNALGTFLEALPLANNATDLKNVTLFLPANATLGPATFTGSLTSLTGARAIPALTYFFFNFTIGTNTSFPARSLRYQTYMA